MTVNTISSIAEFDTNGVTTNFPFYFKFLANEDLVVTYVDPLGTSSVLTLGTHYTVNGAGNDQGGSIVTTSALAGLGQLVVSREMEAFQLTSLRNQGKFLAETHEDVFDKLTMLVQQGFTTFGRALKRPFGRDYFFAENRRITSVKDPIDSQDAATSGWTNRFVAGLIAGIQGPINNAANIFYLAPDGTAKVVQDLSGPEGYKLVGGAAGADDDYTIIRPSLRRISTSLCDIANSLNGVITGDSLSISGFDYPVDWPAAGGGYATENPFGLSSWPHLVRDLCLTVAPAFVPIEDVNISTDADKTYLTSNIYNYAINQKVVNFYFSTVAKKLILQNAYTGAKCLVISYVPVSDSCIFEVDGVEYNNASPDGHYQSHGYMFVPHDGEYATVTNVRYASGTPGGNLWFYGVGDGQRRVPKLTGKGAWTSGQILAEYSTLVAPYSPDYIFYIIGANDIGQGVTVEAFCNNLVSFINLARAAKPHCEIILMSTPPTSSYDRVTAKRYIKGMRKVADDNACSLIDMHSQLEQIDPSYYRYDNIHFNRLGDTIVFNILKNLVFPDVPLDYGKFLPVRQALIGINGNFSKVPVARTRLTALVQCAATPTLVSYLGTKAPGAFAALSMVYSGTGTSSILNITPPAGWVVDSIEDVTIGSATAARVKIQSIGASNVVTAGAMTSAANVDIINSGLYALVNYRQI